MISPTKTRPRCGSRVAVAGLALAALAVGGAVATAPAASAADTANHSVSQASTAGVRIGYGAAEASVQLTAARSASLASGWVAVWNLVNGARMRAYPISGGVNALISPAWVQYSIYCKMSEPDGYVWGYGSWRGHTGWVRGDLWTEVQPTAPGGTGYGTVPWCH